MIKDSAMHPSTHNRMRAEPLEDLLRVAGVVTLHLPLTKETQGILGAAQIARLKKSACIVNTARGALIDQAALSEALLADRLGGFAADVLDFEPPPSEYRLLLVTSGVNRAYFDHLLLSRERVGFPSQNSTRRSQLHDPNRFAHNLS